MKNFLHNFLHFFFGSPVMTVLCSVFVIFLTADSFIKPDEEVLGYTITMSAFPLGESVVETTVCTSSSTTTVCTSSSYAVSSMASSSETAPAEEAIEEPETDSDGISDDEDRIDAPAYNYEYLYADESPNSSFYQDRLVIIGDSVAYGFNAYGYIPSQHNIAKESLAIWNMGNYTFDLGGGDMGLVDAAAYVNSPLYYISIGMNDIYGFTPGDYAWNIRWIAEDVLARVPSATIVVGTITPVSSGNYYTENDTIDEFNAALEAVINDLNSSRVLFFDANAALKDLNTGALSYDYAGGDGLHLNSSAYDRVLDCLFNFLDSTEAVNQINEHENS